MAGSALLGLTYRDATGVLGGLSLRVVEVGRHRHNGLADWSAEEALRSLFHLGQHHRPNLSMQTAVAYRGSDLADEAGEVKRTARVVVGSRREEQQNKAPRPTQGVFTN